MTVKQRAATGEQVFQVMLDNRPQLIQTARRVLRDDMEAEDIVQEVAAAILSAPHLLEGIENAAGWLATLVYRRSIDFLRKFKRFQLRDDFQKESELMDQNSPLEALEEKRIYEAIAAAVNELPKDLRDVFKGNVLEGKTFKQLVEETGIPLGTLLARKKRAVAKLRESLNREGIVPETIPD